MIRKIILSFSIILLATAGYGVYWYQKPTQPNEITALITIPGITPNEDNLTPSNLLIDFGRNNKGFTPQAVAPLSQVGKQVTEGLTLSPEIKGTWIWNSDSELVFTPREDWPAGQKYNIHFGRTFFTPQVPIASHNFSFSTQAFQMKVKEFKFYQDPVNPDLHNAVATIEFNFPVDPLSLEHNTSLLFQTFKNGKFLGNEPLHFSYSYDKNKRTAYLTSSPVSVKQTPQYLLLTLNEKIHSSTGSSPAKELVSKNLFIPDAGNVLKVLEVKAAVLRNKRDRPEQVLTIETTLGVHERDFNKAVHMYLLPQEYPATSMGPAKPNYTWSNPGEVSESILALSQSLAKTAIPTEQNYSPLHSFSFTANSPRYLFIRIDKGMKSFGGFSLNTDYTAVIPVPELPKEISYLHKGSLLALSGENKLSVLVRGLAAVKFDFARILPNNINQLVTQTEGDFNNPYFRNPTFNQQNISQIFSEVRTFDASDLSKQHYTALDLTPYLSSEKNTLGPQGLFLIQASGWDEANKTALDIKANRLVLLTDLGLLVKDNRDGSHLLYVQSITQGQPIAHANISILGKNGLPILSRISDAQGQVQFPNLSDYLDDKEPTVYLAQLGNDVSFIPYNNKTRQLNFSKFDVGGVYSNNQEAQSLSAYLFTDRGIYRPGDTVHVGMIVKQAYAQAQPPGLPLQASVVDARGSVIEDQKMTLNESGFMQLDFTTQSSAPTGYYQINLYLVKDKLPQNILGSTSLKVSEFQPDRMRISSSLIPKPTEGWISPTGLKAKVGLYNLYGAPAANRLVRAKILLTPEQVEFSDYPNYVFTDPLQDPKKPAKILTEDLTDLRTNDQGQAEFDLHLDRFDKANYKLSFFAEGFEAEGGRSVTTQTKALVSSLAYFVGYKADGDLSFIKQNAERSIDFIAINPELSKEDLKELHLQLLSLHPLTTLAKKPDGTYQFQSITQSTLLRTEAFSISAQGTRYALPTTEIGDYQLLILSKDETVLSQLQFTVVGDSQKPLARNAELNIKLNKEEYQAGEGIEIQVTAPYTGSGLITLERDKVFASQWFQAQTSNSVQKIRIPEDFKGNGYVNVAFIRDWSSPELFISPLSYSVLPFEVSHKKQTIKIDLKTPKFAKPGETFAIDYKTDRPAQIIIFAVDEGILQAVHYDTPDPLSFFFQKRALEVLTQQTVDQILPKFIQERELSAVGGDDGEQGLAGRLNPFKRKTDLPVVYWSGIVDSDIQSKELSYSIPDYFNGKLRVMAVAAASDSVGSTETSAQVRADFIISPNTPSFVAPGDEFVVTASIANNLKNSGPEAPIKVALSVSPELQLVSPAEQSLKIPEGQEQTVRYTLRATEYLGSSTLIFRVGSKDQSSLMKATISVRPANPLTTAVESGSVQDVSKTLELIQNFYPAYKNQELTASTSPFILVFGLERYLQNFPYACTEQLTSKALALLAMNSKNWFAIDRLKLQEQLNAAIQMLGQRQTSNGSFAYWPNLSDNTANGFISVYALHFLTEARAQGFNVPNDLFYKGVGFLKELASQNPQNAESARVQAYATYILTRNEIVTSNYLGNLLLYLQQNKNKAWQNDITALYVAASYELMKSHEEALQLIQQYHPQKTPDFSTDFYSAPIANAQYLYILPKHFPEQLSQVGQGSLEQLVQAINNSEINTLLSGYASLALSAYPHLDQASSFTLSELLATHQIKTFPVATAGFQKVHLDPKASQARINNPEKLKLFYQLLQTGFDESTPVNPIKKGMEIFREYRDLKGNEVNSTNLGSEIEVHLKIRALDNAYFSNIAIEDLLPGGFEVLSDSVTRNTMDYVDLREDRILFFGSVDANTKELIYRIKATNTGRFKVPPPYAEAMYNPNTQARGLGSEIRVRDAE